MANRILWTAEEEAKLLEYIASGVKYTDISRMLGRSIQAIQRKVFALRQKGLVLPGRNREWTKEELAYLEANWGKQPPAEIARILSRSAAAVEKRAYLLGLGALREAEEQKQAQPEPDASAAFSEKDICEVFRQLKIGPGDRVRIVETLTRHMRRVVRGVVMSVGDFCVTVRLEQGWREAFQAVDVLTGRVKIKVQRRAA